MKLKSIYLLLISGAFLFASCNNNTPKTQKVVLLQGDFMYDKANSTFVANTKDQKFVIPKDSVLGGTLLSRDTLKATFQLALLVKDNGAYAALCGDNCPRIARNFDFLSITPPPCWEGGCRGIFAIYFESPVEINPRFQQHLGNLLGNNR
jgi:hypothetical protein